MPTSSPSACRAAFSTGFASKMISFFNAYVNEGYRDVAITNSAVVRDSTLTDMTEHIALLDNTATFWSITRIHEVRPTGLVVVSSTGTASLVRYSTIKEFAPGTSGEIRLPHLWLDFGGDELEPIGHVEDDELIETFGEAEYDRQGKLPPFVTVESLDEAQQMHRETESSSGCNVAWLSNEEAYRFPARWRYARAVHEGQTRRIRDESGMVLIVTERSADRISGDEVDSSLSHPQANVFRCEGDMWVLQFRGKRTQVKDLRGLHHIAAMLRSPGRPVPNSALCPRSPERGGHQVIDEDQAQQEGLTVMGLGDAVPVAGYQALREVQKAKEELTLQRAEAEANGNAAEARRIDSEIDHCAQYLASGTGLRGRARRCSDPAERARKSIREAVSRSLKRIQMVHEPLWRHLRASIHIQRSNSIYSPERPIRWYL